MSHTKVRIEQFAEQVKAAGIAGKSMQDKLAEIISNNDLTSHEIDRVAELANRDVQLHLYKTSSDKRFKFDIIDPTPLKAAAKAAATKSATLPATTAQKVSSVVMEDGDPFAVPYRETAKLSLFEQPMNMKTAAEMDISDIRKTFFALDQKRAEYELVLGRGRGEVFKIAGEAEKSYSKSVQAAIDMIIGGVTLPSLYTAVAASVGGGGATDEDRKQSDALMMLVIKGIKERGIPNHRLGFKHQGNINLLDSLSAEDLLMLCKRSTGRIYEQDVPTALTKVAEYLSSTHDELEPALARSGNVVQPYLDEKYVDNLPGGKPLVINGENEFVIAVKDLIGDQSRMRRCHAANEYIGLKLLQIETALRGLKTAKTAAEAKMATYGPATPKPGLFDHATRFVSHPLTQAGIASAPFVIPAVQSALSSPPKETEEDKMNRRLKSGSAKLEIEQEHKLAFPPALAAGIGTAANIAGIVGTGLAVKDALTPAAPAAPKQPKLQQSAV